MPGIRARRIRNLVLVAALTLPVLAACHYGHGYGRHYGLGLYHGGHYGTGHHGHGHRHHGRHHRRGYGY